MKQTELKKFYFTFGCGQDNAGYCQPIYAKDYETARKRMFGIHGAKWAFQYTEEQWEENKARAIQCFYSIEKEMTPIYCKEGADDG